MYVELCKQRRHIIQSYILTYYRLRKMELLIALPPSEGEGGGGGVVFCLPCVFQQGGGGGGGL